MAKGERQRVEGGREWQKGMKRNKLNQPNKPNELNEPNKPQQTKHKVQRYLTL